MVRAVYGVELNTAKQRPARFRPPLHAPRRPASTVGRQCAASAARGYRRLPWVPSARGGRS